MANINNSQFPGGLAFLGGDGRVTQPWAFWLQNFEANLPPSGSGYVVDGTATAYGEMVIFQGADSNKGSSPSLGYIYFAVDTGKIYVEQAGNWVEQSPELTGDMFKAQGSNEVTLNTVNNAVGTWGSPTSYPVITVNEKGLVTNVTTEAIVPGGAAIPGGLTDQLQFNAAGSFAGTATVTYDAFTGTLISSLQHVTDEITFTDPVPTLNNLLPDQTGHEGEILVTDGTNAVWSPLVPSYEFTFNFGDATPKLLMNVPADRVITQINMYVTEAFNGTTPSLSIGDTGDYASLMDTTDNNPIVISNWAVTPGKTYGADTDIYLSIVAGSGATTGAGLLVIQIQN